MSDPYIGEIRMWPANFAPAGWMLCKGQLVPISESEALFNLIGTTYGGDGQSTFALPDLQGRVPVDDGQGAGQPTRILGEKGGAETVGITTATMAAHSHAFMASGTQGGTNNASGNVPAANLNISLYYEDVPAPTAALTPDVIKPDGGNQPHDNMQKFLVINFIISLYGLYPPPT